MSGQADSLGSGTTLGQYKLVEQIAVGGMGTVYRAHDQSLDRFVALKVLAPELAQDPQIARRFLDEARSLAALSHPHIVHLYTAGEHAGTYYFASELVTGENLETHLAHRRHLAPRVAADLVRQAARGLQYAHERGLVHGDVKPANFLLAENNTVKVTDFGLAHRVRASAATDGAEFGTPDYLSPEVIRGEAPDHRSDIYSLGITLYAFLTGAPPFAGNTPAETLRRHLEDSIPPLPTKIPPNLTRILDRMLAKPPAARYQSYTELLHVLDEFLTERPLAPRPLARDPRPVTQPPATPAPAPPNAPTVWLSFALTVIAAGFAIATYYLYHQRPTAPPPPTAINIVAQPATPPPPATNIVAGPATPPPPPPVIPPPEAPQPKPAPQVDTRREQAQQEHARRLAAEAEAARLRQEQAARVAAEAETQRVRQTKLDQWAVQANTNAVSMQWDRGLQEARRAVTEAGADAVLQPIAARYQATFEALLALRTATAARLKTTPLPVTLPSKHGELTGQITGLTADNLTLQKPVGNFGFAETVVPWSDLTPAGIARIFAATDSIGYAVLLLEQGIARQAKLDDIRKAVRAATDRYPGPLATTLFTDYETRLADLERLEAQAVARRQAELDTQTHWAQIQQAAMAGLWPKAGELLAKFNETDLTTDFAKKHADEIQRLGATIAERNKPKDFTPLDIGSACNGKFLVRDGECDFYGKEGIKVEREHQLVPLVDTKPGGTFRLRLGEQFDAIGITWATGRFPNEAILKLPAAQRGRYARLALLTAVSVGNATVNLQCDYETGDPQRADFKTYNVLTAPNIEVPGHPALEVLHPRNRAVSHRLYQEVIELDPKRRLTGLRFTWVNSGTQHPLHCVGIFAVSAIPAP